MRELFAANPSSLGDTSAVMVTGSTCSQAVPELPCSFHVYDLREGAHSSRGFYEAVARFSDEMLAIADKLTGSLLDAYAAYCCGEKSEEPRNRGEYLIDLLWFGLVQAEYEGAAQTTSTPVLHALRALLWARARLPWTKPLVDWLRGGIHGLALGRIVKQNNLRTRWQRLDHLILWMNATGISPQETSRFAGWVAYLKHLEPRQAGDALVRVEKLFTEFRVRASDSLGMYTRHVAAFLVRQQAQDLWREDRLLRSKPESEYHLNMIAVELLNRGLADQYAATTRRVVLLPTCMRGRKSSICKAKVDGLDITCTACDPACAVNRITRRMRVNGQKVYLVPHASGFTKWLERWQGRGVGVTAAACMLHILPGGYEMRARGIASQCVPLDFPGCRKHWDVKGLSTELNELRLVQIASVQLADRS